MVRQLIGKYSKNGVSWLTDKEIGLSFKVEAILDVASLEIAKEKKKIISSSPGSTRITNEVCGPYVVLCLAGSVHAASTCETLPTGVALDANVIF